MLQNLKTRAARFAVAPLLLASGVAFADEATNPIVTMLESVSLTGVAAAVAAVALAIIAVALTFKGPDVAKRVIRKV